MSDVLLTDIQQTQASFDTVDAAGNPVTPVAGTVTWSSTDTSILTITPAADGLTAVAATTGKLGTVQVTVKLTPTDGSAALSDSATVDVVSSAATSIKLVFGTPTVKV